MEAVLSVTIPVFLIALVGFAYARFRHLDISSTGQLNLDIFVPALLLYALSEKLPDVSDVGPLVLMGVVIIVGSGPLARVFGIQSTVLLPPVMFNNSGNLGLPLALFAFGDEGLPWAVALFVTSTLLHFTLGMAVLQGHLRVWLLLKNPVVMAMFGGIGMYLLDLHFPPIILDGIRLMADVAIPLMLVSLGFYLAKATAKDMKVGLIGAVLTPITGLVAALIDLTSTQMAAVFLFAALPPAVMNSMLAERFNVAPEQVASIVAQGNILSIGFIPLVLYWILP